MVVSGHPDQCNAVVFECLPRQEISMLLAQHRVSWPKQGRSAHVEAEARSICNHQRVRIDRTAPRAHVVPRNAASCRRNQQSHKILKGPRSPLNASTLPRRAARRRGVPSQSEASRGRLADTNAMLPAGATWAPPGREGRRRKP